jgi:hypothetical protein
MLARKRNKKQKRYAGQSVPLFVDKNLRILPSPLTKPLLLTPPARGATLVHRHVKEHSQLEGKQHCHLVIYSEGFLPTN